MISQYQLILKTDPSYPPLLREIADPPAKLFHRGEPLNPKASYFAIVGTRRASLYGKQMAEHFSGVLAAKGFTIVSGLAFGIDTIAHEAALEAGGKTIAVLGSGLNNIFPPCNRGLAKKIEQHGCLISEFEPDAVAYKSNFPQRNRIIAGMSFATLVIEGPERSGALITARFALEYNRDVFAIPGNITQSTSLGTNRLIRDALAYPVATIEDIFDYLEIPRIEEKSAAAVNTNEEMILGLLKKSALSVDHLVMETKWPPSKIISTLSMLELKGRIKMNGSYAFVTR